MTMSAIIPLLVNEPANIAPSLTVGFLLYLAGLKMDGES
jgi:hypothetical protein